MRSILILVIALSSLSALAAKTDEPAKKKKELMFTTYFYTANEAVVHGYTDGTKMRIVDLAKKGTVWQGKVDRGETKLIPTGAGVFAFLTDKKASILVGTPSRCSAVGYWARDENGRFRSQHFFSQLPGGTTGPTTKVIVWAWEDVKVRVKNYSDKQKKSLFDGKLKANTWWELDSGKLNALNNHVLSFEADKPAISVQIYYDEGFFVPSTGGWGVGKRFRTYVGAITSGMNDLLIMSYGKDAKVTVTDLKAKQKKKIWKGTVKAGGVHTMTLTDKYVEITSDNSVAVAVTPYKHHTGGYVEHHYSPGAQGSGIDRDFLVTTPGELWVFSYYSDNPVTVTKALSGDAVWNKSLGKGTAAGVNPGYGFYRVRSEKGVSVMGGFGACGAEFSPAGGMFAVDEALFAVIQEIREQRQQRAEARGETLSAEDRAAPLSADEKKELKKRVRKKSSAARGAASGPAASAPAASMSDAELEERLEEIESDYSACHRAAEAILRSQPSCRNPR